MQITADFLPENNAREMAASHNEFYPVHKMAIFDYRTQKVK